MLPLRGLYLPFYLFLQRFRCYEAFLSVTQLWYLIYFQSVATVRVNSSLIREISQIKKIFNDLFIRIKWSYII